MDEIKLLDRLDKQINGTLIDPDTRIVLDMLNNIILDPQIPNKIYEAYVRYVGDLDAFSPNELYISDLIDETGRLLPLPNWPTKSSPICEATLRVEINNLLKQKKYGAALQRAIEGNKQGEVSSNFITTLKNLAKRKKLKVETSELDPCQDQSEYIWQKMSDCMKIAKQAKKVDTKTARDQCAKQMDRLQQELDKTCGPEEEPEEAERWVERAKKVASGYEDADDPFIQRISRLLER